MVKYRVKKLGKFWWILGSEETGPWGPYASRKEAVDDKRGVERAEKLDRNSSQKDEVL